jgi:hypothetical protein
MHIKKNVTETLWRIIDGRRDKEKIVKICNDIREANHAMQSVIQSNNDRDQNNLPWLLTEKQSNGVKEVIQKIKFPTGFWSNIKNILTKKGEFGGVKTHDVVSLFTNIPLNKEIMVVKEVADPETTKLAKVCLRSTFFSYQRKFYEQTSGVAMGSPLSPIVDKQ